MHRKFNILFYWLPPIIWMGIIFYMSSQRSIVITTNTTTDFITFKTLHMIEYAFLFFLLYRAFLSLKYVKNNMSGICAFCVTMLYSLTDELHQLHIPTRQGRLRDILFDVAGMLLMYGIIKQIRLIQKLL